MPWIEKHHPSTLDHQPIEGLHYLDGAILAALLSLEQPDTEAWWINLETLKGLKAAQIEFPSGLAFPIREATDSRQGGLIQLFGVIDLPYFGSRDEAWQQIQPIAHVMGYSLVKRGEDQIEIHGSREEDHLTLTYDADANCIQDIAHPRQPERASQDPLLDDETRARLPKLYSTDDQELNALAQVKFFDLAPGGWIWFASEFDGQDIFFGLVIGFVIELGHFSLSELKDLRARHGQAIQRDPHFTPTSLKDLIAKYEQDRS